MPESPLDERSRALRRLVVRAIGAAGRGHLGPAYSLIEILRVLYDEVLRHRPGEPGWPERDRLILSKGHGCLALYALLADHGYFPVDWLDRFCAYRAELGGHPEAGPVPGVEASTGALGHGLPIGVGMAIAARIASRPSRVVVVMGDGETNEGSVWEAALMAAKHRLSNLVAVVDANGMQAAGPTAGILDMEPMADRWQSFGFRVEEADGHDPVALRAAFGRSFAQQAQPSVLICRTIKGKGFRAAEHNPDWHHKNKLAPADLSAMLGELAPEVASHA